MLTYADVCIAAACDLDYDTMAGGDKFGNVFLCRLSSEASDALADTTSGAQDASLPLSAGAAEAEELVSRVRMLTYADVC